MAGRSRRGDHVPEIVLHVATVEAQFARETRDGARR
jgi:hypothetical protein